MRKPCYTLVCCVLLSFGLCVVIRAEDVPETAYDESEALPYASTTVFSFPLPNTFAPAPSERPIVAVSSPGSFKRFRSHRPDHRSGSVHPISDSLIILDQSLRC